MDIIEQIPQQIVNGLVTGSLYAMIALGYTMVYGILGIINFAHAEVFMIGAVVAAKSSAMLLAMGLPTPLVLVLAMMIAVIVCVITSLIMERVAYRPLRNAPKLAPLITAIGISLILQALVAIIWSSNPIPMPELMPSKRIELFAGAGITARESIIVVTSLLIMFGLLILVEKTKLGRAMRATSENVSVAGLMGVNPNRTIAITFMIGAALAAIAGVFYASNYGQAHYFMGFSPGMKAFIAAVLGGIGNIKGALVGGLVLGLAEALGVIVVPVEYQDVFAFAVLVIVLIFKPSGLLGQRVADRA